MTPEILEAVIRRIETSGVIGDRSVYVEGFVPKSAEWPRTTILYTAVAPAGATHSGMVNKWTRAITINSIGANPQEVGSAGSLQQLKQAMEEADEIVELFNQKEFGVTLASGRSIRILAKVTGGTAFRDTDTKESVVQHFFELTHDS